MEELNAHEKAKQERLSTNIEEQFNTLNDTIVGMAEECSVNAKDSVQILDSMEGVLEFTNNLGKPRSKNIEALKYLNNRYIFSDYNSSDPYYIYNFGTNLEGNPTFDTATKYISHGASMPRLKYCINGRYLGLDNTPTTTYTKVVYTDILQNPPYSRIVFDSYFNHSYLQNNTDSKIRLYKYKSAHNISRDEDTGNFYSKYGEKPTIYITAIPAAARFDLLVNEYAEV